jgi:hypothetical protein
MENITIFIDNVGRMIIGDEVKSKSKSIFSVKNPAVVNVQADQNTGQISVQLLPYVFSEFIKADQEDPVWSFNKANITTSDNLQLDERITEQYTQIMSNSKGGGNATLQGTAGTVQNTADEEPEVIKLFDE